MAEGCRGQEHIPSIRAIYEPRLGSQHCRFAHARAEKTATRCIFGILWMAVLRTRLHSAPTVGCALRATGSGLRLLTANAKRDLSITLFGQRFNLPFVIAPTGLNGIHWRSRGYCAGDGGGQGQETGFALSTASTDLNRRRRCGYLQVPSGFSFIPGATVRSAHACSSGRKPQDTRRYWSPSIP